MSTSLHKVLATLLAWSIYSAAAWSYWVDKTIESGPWQVLRVLSLMVLIGVAVWKDAD